LIAPRWRKVLRDIAGQPGRTVLAVLAMGAGVFGVTTILSSWLVLTRELATTYADTRPSSATLFAESIGDGTVEAARRTPGVADAEARPLIQGRIRVGDDEWVPLVVFVVRDFENLRLDTFKPDSGAWPPGDDEILLERSALTVARAKTGDTVTARVAGVGDRRVRIAGTVHAPGLAPAWMEHAVSGFVSWGSILRAGASSESPQLRILVASNPLDAAHIRAVASKVKISLEAMGDPVARFEVPPPGRHPHADQMETFLFLLGAFGVLALGLGALLVATMIQAVLAEQVGQIGVMKAVGATTGQIASLYLGQVAILAGISLVVAIPLGVAAGLAYTRFSVDILNATLANASVPLPVFGVVVVVGLLVPMAVSLAPVRRASRLSVHEAFSDGIARRPFGTRAFDRFLARLRFLPRPLMLSVRSAFHRPGRLALTVGTLAAGGAVFMSALNVSAAWTHALDEDSRGRRYDLDVWLDRPESLAKIAGVMAGLPDVTRFEFWGEASVDLTGTAMEDEEGGHGDGSSGRVAVLGPDARSPMLALPLVSGRWLDPADDAGVVVNQSVLRRSPQLAIGGPIDLVVDGKSVSKTIVGVVKEMFPVPVIYATRPAVLAMKGQSGESSRSVRVATRDHAVASQIAVAGKIERAMEEAGIGVRHVQSLGDRRKAIADHLVIIVSVLVAASGLVVLVGGIGVTSTLGLGVLERTRELGILGAIGATPGTIARSVVFEGVLTGVLSGCLAIVAAWPATLLLDRAAGRMFIRIPLDFVMSPGAVGAWLGMVVVLSVLSSFVPAWRAARLVVREALSHA